MSHSQPSREQPDLLDTAAAGPAAIRGGVVRVAGYTAGSALSVVAAALLFRQLGIVDAGRYVAVLAIVAVSGGLTDAGLTAIAVRELAVRPRETHRDLMADLLGIRIALTLAGVAGGLAFVALAGYEDVLVLGVLLAGVALVFQMVQATVGAPLAAQLRLGWISVADLARQAAGLVIVALLVVAGAPLTGFFAGLIVANAVALVLTWWAARRSVPLAPQMHWSRWAPLLRDALPFALATAVAALYFRVAMIIVSLVASDVETGYFGASFRVVEVLVVVPQMLVGAAFPILARAARDDRARLSYAAGRMLQTCLALAAGVALVLGFGAPVIIDVVAGPDFGPAADVLAIQGIGVGAAFAGAVWAYVLLGLRLHREVLMVNLAALVLAGILTVVAAEAEGALGAAAVTAAVEVGVALAFGLALARAGSPISIPRGPLARIALAAAAAGGVGVALAATPALGTVAAVAVVYVVLLVVLRALPEEFAVEVTRLRRRRGG